MKRFPLPALFTLLTLLFLSCSKDDNKDEPKEQVFKGAPQKLGAGFARSWVRISKEGFPMELGVEMSQGALNDLPLEHQHPTPEHTTPVLPLHEKAVQNTIFDHIGINWQPHGHPPANLFTEPHFDIHFYMISQQERKAIPPFTPNGLFGVAPPAGYMPANYTIGPGGEAQMGAHWSLPRPQIEPFAHTMILGTYNGRFIFMEPMVTHKYLKSGEHADVAIGQPEKFKRKGDYPTRYKIYHDDQKNIHVTLTDFVSRNAQ